MQYMLPNQDSIFSRRADALCSKAAFDCDMYCYLFHYKSVFLTSVGLMKSSITVCSVWVQSSLSHSGLLGWTGWLPQYLPWTHTDLQNQIPRCPACHKRSCLGSLGVSVIVWITECSVNFSCFICDCKMIFNESEASFDKTIFFCSYPLILSLENHCGLGQQRNMAMAFRDTFGSK